MKIKLLLLTLVPGICLPGYSQTFTETINLNVTSDYGGDFPTDNSYYTNVLAIGGAGAEKGLKIYKQNPGSSPSFVGPVHWNDSYVFEMTDTNSPAPDGGILFGGTGNDDVFKPLMVIRGNGRVGIGVTNPGNRFEVNGTIRSKEVKVEASSWPDYVFDEDYDLKSIEETEKYIQENKHLPNMPSAAEIEENGVSLGEMNAKLLEKIEELTLYIIDQDREIAALGAKLKEEGVTVQTVEKLMLHSIRQQKIIEQLIQKNESLENRVTSLEGSH